jgi:uncharacterized protein YacL (UPF0231 family)
MQLEFYWDEAGDARARVPHDTRGKAAGHQVAGFLESDLQGSAAAPREVLHAIDEVESGRVPSWERTGNSHTLTLSRDGATIRNEMNEDAKPHHLTLQALRKAVGDWLEFLESRGRS